MWPCPDPPAATRWRRRCVFTSSSIFPSGRGVWVCPSDPLRSLRHSTEARGAAGHPGGACGLRALGPRPIGKKNRWR